MHFFWDTIIRPVLEAVRPKTLVEIGTWQGKTTALLLRFCAEHHAVLHAIDPLRSSEMDRLQSAYPDHFMFHEDASLNVLGHLDKIDVVLIDGDHNWYTVYHELLLLERMAERTGTFPLVLLHDTGWPYAYRDMYCDPARIPAAYVQPHSKGGIALDHGLPREHQGFQQQTIHAMTENGMHNGVLGAVEDFLKQTHLHIQAHHVPGFFGMTLLVPQSLIEQHPSVSVLLDEIRPNGRLHTYIQQLERHRLEVMTAREEENWHSTRRITTLQERVAELNTQLEHRQEAVETLQDKLDAATHRTDTLAKLREGEHTLYADESLQYHRRLTLMQRELRDARAAVLQLRGNIHALETRDREQSEQERIHSTSLEGRIHLLESQLDHVYRTRSWRWTAWMRKADGMTHGLLHPQAVYRIFGMLKRIWTAMGEPFPGLVRAIRHSVLTPWPAQPSAPAPSSINYHAQLLAPSTHLPYASQEKSRTHAASLPFQPSVTIIIHTDLVDEILLRRTLNSISEQTYSAWNVIVTCTQREPDVLSRILADYEHYYPGRFQLLIGQDTDGSSLSNTAISQSSSMYVCLLQPTDTMQPDALEQLITAGLNAAQWPDLLYGDHDVLSAEHPKGYEPVLKPAWSPELLLSYNYIGQTFLVKRELLLPLLDPLPPPPAAYAYDILLRIAETNPSVVRVPHILHHHVEPVRSEKDALRAVIQSALMRRGLSHTIDIHPSCLNQQSPYFRLRYTPPTLDTPKVCIIIPTKDHASMLRQCLEAIQRHTRYPNYEIIIIDSNSKEEETRRYLQSLPHRVVRIETEPFSFSAINNRAAELTDAPFILLLNNDALPHSDGWLTDMMGIMALDDHIGVVGAKLLYPPGREYAVQSVGMIVGRHWASLVKFRTNEEPGYGNYNHVMRNCAANGGACLLTRTPLFRDVGGLDEHDFAVDFSDVDYCLKLMQAGYRTVIAPYAEIVHHESHTRGNNNGKGANVDVREYTAFERKWGHLFGHDPYYHPRFSLHLHDEPFTLT